MSQITDLDKASIALDIVKEWLDAIVEEVDIREYMDYELEYDVEFEESDVTEVEAKVVEILADLKENLKLYDGGK